MAGVVLQARLAFDKIGDPPRGPEPGAISQDFGSFFEAPAQGIQLFGLEPGFTSGPARLLESRFARLLPLLEPSPG